MRRTGIYTIFFLALAGLFLFTAQSAWAVFTEVSATAAYNDVKDSGTDAVIIDVRTVDEHNGLIPPWSASQWTIDTDTAYNGTPKWRVNGKTHLPINIPWWVNESTTYPTLAPDDATEVTDIIQGLLERGVIDYNTRLYFLCRTGVRSRYMATWMDGRTFSTKTGSGTFANLYNIDGDGTGTAEGGMSEWNADSLPKYMGMGEHFSFTTVPPQVFATFDGSTTFTVSILEPTPSTYFPTPSVTRVSLQMFDKAGYRGNEVAFYTNDTSGSLWTNYKFDSASTTAPFEMPIGAYTWRALAANNAGRGLNNNALGVSDISAIEAESSAAARTGIIVDVRTWEEHNGCAVTGQAPSFSYNCASTSSNARSPEWTDTLTGVTVLPPDVPFWISRFAGAFPEDTGEFQSITGYLKQAGVIDFNKRIYLISTNGYRGYWAGVYMQKLGFRNVYSIDGLDTYAGGGMLEWYKIDGLATNPDFHGPQIYAVTPPDGYANGAVPFKVGIIEVPRADGKGHPCVSSVSLFVGDASSVGTTPVATSNVDTTEGTLWTEYSFPSYTPAAGSHTWDVRAQSGWGSSSAPYSCPATDPAQYTMWNAHAYAAGPGDRSLGVSTGIAVTDDTGTADDLEVNFGDKVAVNTDSASQTITVTNKGTSPLTMNDTSFTDPALGLSQADFDPFTIADNCSTAGTLANGGTCTVDVVFSPTAVGSFGKVIRINSDDATVPQVKVAMCGTTVGTAPRWTSAVTTDSTVSDGELLSLLSDCAVPAVNTAAPTVPDLLSPADGAENVPTDLTFTWNTSTDADGDAVSYQVCYAPDGEALEGTNCHTVGDVAKGNSSTLYAGLGSGAGLLFFGMVLAGSARRRKIALLIALMAITAMFLVSCGKSTTDTSSTNGTNPSAVTGIKTYHAPVPLDADTPYTWKVIASDGQGGEASSEVWSFTTGN